MNFDLSEEQELLQSTVRQFLDNECPAPQLRAIFEGETGHDPALWKGMAEMGLAGLTVPEAYGGTGLEMIDLALVTEILGYCGAPGPFFGHALATLALVTTVRDDVGISVRHRARPPFRARSGFSAVSIFSWHSFLCSERSEFTHQERPRNQPRC